MPYLYKRVLDDGCGNAAQLCRELREQGYRGSVRTIRRYIAPLRAGLHLPELLSKPPSVREVRRWITSNPAHLTDIDNQRLSQVITLSLPLDRLHRHVTAFAKMLIQRTGTRDLDRWLATVNADDLPHLHSFANGLRRDHAAVLNGLSLSAHDNGDLHTWEVGTGRHLQRLRGVQESMTAIVFVDGHHLAAAGRDVDTGPPIHL
jgi:transposase